MGHYMIEGVVKVLDKPFVIMNKEQERSEMCIAGIVKRKILFAERPQPKTATGTVR